MPYTLTAPTSLTALTSALFPALMLAFLLFFHAERTLSPGQPRKQAQFLIFFLFIGFLWALLGALPFAGHARTVLFHLAFIWSASFPLLIHFILVRSATPRRKTIPIIAVTVPVLMISLVYPIVTPYLLFFAFFPAWVAALVSTWNAYRQAYIAFNRRTLFYSGFACFLAGYGFFLDCLLAGRFQDLPLLTLAFSLWAGVLIINALSSPVKTPAGESQELNRGTNWQEPALREAVPFLALPMLIPVGLGVYAGVRYFMIEGNSLTLFNRFHPVLAFIIALGLTVLYTSLEASLASWLTGLSERYLSPLAKEILEIERTRGEDISPENAGTLLESAGLNVLPWLRERNSRRYVSIIPTDSTTGENHLILESRWELRLQECGVVLPEEGLLVSCGHIPAPFLPAGLIRVHRTTPAPFTADEIRQVIRFANLLQPSTTARQSERYPTTPNLLKDLASTTTLEEFGSLVTGVSDAFLRGAKVQLLIQPSETPGDLFIVRSPDFQGDFRDPVPFVQGEPDEAGLYRYTPEVDSPNNISTRILRLPMTQGQGFLLFQVSEDQFIYESQDRMLLASAAETCSFVLDRILLMKRYLRQAADLEDVALKAEERLASERKQVAASLHDTVAQEIYAARMQVELIQRQLAENLPDSKEDLQTLRETVEEGLKHVREMIRNLRSADTAKEVNPEKEINGFLARIEKETGMTVISTGLDHLEALPGPVAAELVMIAREAVNNIRKHARASRTGIHLRKKPYGFSLLVIDNGKGFDTKEAVNGKESFGFTSMKTRCRKLNAALFIRSAPGKGTAIWAMLPVNI